MLLRLLFVASAFLTTSVEAADIVRVKPIKVGACASPCDRVAVFFIHGLDGSEATWKNSDTNANFLQLLSGDPVLGQSLDLYQIDYDSFFVERSPTMAKLQTAMAEKLDKLIMTEKNYTRVVFIAHSLGGIVTSRYLMHLKLRWHHDNLARVRLVMTFGTPFAGGNNAAFLHVFSHNPQVNILIADNDFMQAMTGDMIDLRQKRNGNAACPPLQFYAAYEKNRLGFTRLVEEESAVLFANEPGDSSRGFDLNHVELVKPGKRDDGGVYDWTSAALKKCVDRDSLCSGEIQPQCR